MWPFNRSKILIEELLKTTQQQQKVIESLKIKMFRMGDKVYINDGKRDPAKEYYLLEPYNGGECYYVGESMDFDHKNLCLIHGVNIIHISHYKPDKCKCCGNLL